MIRYVPVPDFYVEGETEPRPFEAYVGRAFPNGASAFAYTNAYALKTETIDLQGRLVRFTPETEVPARIWVETTEGGV